MKTFYKVSFVVFALLIITPSIALASWWNPLSWNIFSFLFQNNQVMQTTVGITNPVDQSSVMDTASATSTTVTAKVVSTTPASPSKTVKVVPKVTPPAVGQTASVQTQTPQITTPTGTLCNGTYWAACPSGQSLICPQTGSAYCQSPQPPVQQQSASQICSAMNATWGGEYGSNGLPNCTCNTGYVSGSDGKSCVVAPVKTGYQVCSESYPNETWDGTYSSTGKYNCTCQTGYTWNSSTASCLATGIYTQQQTAPSVSTACLQAEQAVQTAQNQYNTFQQQNPYMTAAQSNPNIAADLSTGRGQILGNELAGETQAYATAVQNALEEEQVACQ